MLLAIDPGVTSGWATFKEGSLTACGINLTSIPPQTTRVVIEIPRIYPGGRTKNPNDVLSVAVRAGEWGGLARARGLNPEYIEPRAWKGGNVPKPIQDARDWSRLTSEEQAIVDKAARKMAPGKRNHMIDAIGIGLKAVGR